MLLTTTALVMALSGPFGTSSLADEQPLPASEQAQAQSQSQAREQDPKDQKADEKKPPTPPHTGIRALVANLGQDLKHLPAMQNLYLAGIGGGLAAAAHPADQSFNVRLRSHYDTVNKAFAAGKYFGDTPEQVALSLGTYAFGRIFDRPKVS